MMFTHIFIIRKLFLPNSRKDLLHVQWMRLAFALISLFLMHFQIHFEYTDMPGSQCVGLNGWYLGVFFLTLSNQLNSALV